ncbi:redoxin domain-containing protein [Flavobacteriaceae bacterium XHP0103]|uniref:TlpA family protein disulfide reductase n=1 Tax=Marixanthotalea marina TaxID=2844359 RepID=UPI002989D797|nr:thioredoxin-like domain-containing protein [Marixanthotalea marina]MBU3820950.1 redoxin domain-containing protein [Marixanthotalea marina]
MTYKHLIIFLVLLSIWSCKKDKVINDAKEIKPNSIVLITKNAPSKYVHLIKQDSLGKKLNDSLGPKMMSSKNGFTYLDYMNIVRTWTPKPKINDTLVIECYTDYLELSTKNPFTSINETFLVKNGDTLIFNYENNIPQATITNRDVNDIELNYNNYRLKKLFNNKYTSHSLILLNPFFNDDIKDFETNSIAYYNKSKKDYEIEKQLLDSLFNANILTEINYNYRKNALSMLMEKHKNLKNIKKWLEQNKTSKNKEVIEKSFGFDLSKTDSLMKFSFFRDYLGYISEYNLDFIEENNGNSGAIYVDSRVRFDSILQDRRFNQTAKNYLLFDAYNGIGQNFKVKDKEKYFKKLQENVTNTEQLNKLQKDYKLDFSKSDKLLLTSLSNESTTFHEVLNKNKGKWLYIDFWASWCSPCRETMPESNKLKKELENENIDFVYLSLNDKKDKWQQTINTFGISKSQNYFIENGNVSKVIEDLGIKTIPHYLIYNPNGELVNGYANRPGKGAKEQLKTLMDVK